MSEPLFTDQVARLRVCVSTGQLPSDLGRWTLAVLTDLLPDAERIAMRNHHLRAAADLVSGSIEAKARRVSQEALVLKRRLCLHGLSEPQLSTVRGCVLAALQIDRHTPMSVRQIRRILSAPA